MPVVSLKKAPPTRKAAAEKAVAPAKAVKPAPVRYVVLDTPLRSEKYPDFGRGFLRKSA
ncbi:MAG TPA: hypothetical protein VGM81_09220 [Burkholderiaceae bacterium]|jgi:hypothetical protein